MLLQRCFIFILKYRPKGCMSNTHDQARYYILNRSCHPKELVYVKR